MAQQLGPLLSGATSVLYDADAAGAACAVRQLPAFQEAAQQRRVQPLRPLMHKLRWGGCSIGRQAAFLFCGKLRLRNSWSSPFADRCKPAGLGAPPLASICNLRFPAQVAQVGG